MKYRQHYDHLLSAMATIYRDIVRNPRKMSARTHLEYLRVIRLHLDRMVGKQGVAPSLNNLIEQMIQAANDLIEEHTGM